MSHTYPYPLPAVTVDLVIFRKNSQDDLEVLLIKRRDDPFKDHWALPGGFVEVGVGHKPEGDQGESLIEAAARELKEETNLDVQRDNLFLEQLQTFGDPGRDPRGRVISVAYLAMIHTQASLRVQAGDDAIDHRWARIEPTAPDLFAWLPGPLAFDHAKILTLAVARYLDLTYET